MRDIDLVCPLCHREMEVVADAYHCARCQRTYPLHAGIPDFRVFPDPYLDFDEDRARTEIVLDGLDKQRDLESLLVYYWSFSDVTPIPLRGKFVRSAMLAERKAARILQLLEGTTFTSAVTPRTALEKSYSGRIVSTSATTTWRRTPRSFFRARRTRRLARMFVSAYVAMAPT